MAAVASWHPTANGTAGPLLLANPWILVGEVTASGPNAAVAVMMIALVIVSGRELAEQ